jgi:hypothetical protein
MDTLNLTNIIKKQLNIILKEMATDDYFLNNTNKKNYTYTTSKIQESLNYLFIYAPDDPEFMQFLTRYNKIVLRDSNINLDNRTTNNILKCNLLSGKELIINISNITRYLELVEAIRDKLNAEKLDGRYFRILDGGRLLSSYNSNTIITDDTIFNIVILDLDNINLDN